MEKTKEQYIEELNKVLSNLKEKDDAVTKLNNERYNLRYKRDYLEGKIRASSLYYEGDSTYILYLTKTKIPYQIINGIMYISIKYTCLAASIDKYEFMNHLKDMPLFENKFKEVYDIGISLPSDYLLSGLLTFKCSKLSEYSKLRDEAMGRILEVYNLIRSYV